MQDDAFKALSSPRLRIRRFVAADARALSGYRSDPAVARYQSFEPCSLDDAHGFIASLAGVAPGTPGEWFQFAVALEGSDELVGDCALHCTASDPRQAEPGFSFARAFQGRGYATEAVRRLLDYAFTTLGLHRVYALTDERNHAAHRLLERLGFRREGRLRESFWSKGEWTTEVLWAVLRAEWRGAPRGGSPQ